MCERCKATKAAALEMLAAHTPALASTVAQRIALDDCWATFRTVYYMSEEQARLEGAKQSEELWQRLHSLKVRDLDELRVILHSIRQATNVLLGHIKNVLEVKVVNEHETEGLDPELVDEMKQVVMRRNLGKVLMETFGATVDDPNPLAKPHPFSSATPIET